MAVKYSPAAYAAANDFIRRLRQYRGRLSREQLKTLRGLALKGDIDGAVKGLGKILKREDWHMVRPLTLEAALDMIEKERPIVIESRRFGIIANWFTAFDKDGFLIWLRVQRDIGRYPAREYGRTWRAWDQNVTQEQVKTAPWG